MDERKLIYADDAIRWIKVESNPYGKPTLDFESGKKIIAYLERLPSVQPERMRGKWKGYNSEKPDWQRTDGSPVFLICSECGATVVNNFAAKWNYCCVCGAEMGEQNET